MGDYKGDKQRLFNAYIGSLQSNPDQFRKDARSIQEWATGASSLDNLMPDSSGTQVQKDLAGISKAFGSGKKAYNKFIAIGIFRILELGSSMDPASLEKLSTALGAPLDKVTSDLATYKALLSKLTKARELMADVLEEQRKRQRQRDAEMADKDKAESSPEGPMQLA